MELIRGIACRRRRIKCGEERPICANCIKAKRQCEGYELRFIFKDPPDKYRIAAAAALANQAFSAGSTSSSTSQHSQFHQVPQQQHAQQTSLPNIPPKQDLNLQEHHPTESVSIPNLQISSGQVRTGQEHAILSESDVQHGWITSGIYNAIPPGNTPYDSLEPSRVPKAQSFLREQVIGDAETYSSFDDEFGYGSTTRPSDTYETFHSDWHNSPIHSSKLPSHVLLHRSDIPEAESTILTQSYQGSENWSLYRTQENPSHAEYVPLLQAQAASASIDQQVHNQVPLGSEDHSWQDYSRKGQRQGNITPLRRQREQPEDLAKYDQPPFVAIRQQALTALNAKRNDYAIDWTPGDGAYKRSLPSEEEFFAQLDDNMKMEDYEHDTEIDPSQFQHKHLKNNDLGIVVALQAFQYRQDQRLRTYHSLLDGYGPDVLSTYEPSAHDSPLRDSITAMIFYHFINVIGPGISSFERHPANPSLMFQSRPLPKSQQHIWSCR